MTDSLTVAALINVALIEDALINVALNQLSCEKRGLGSSARDQFDAVFRLRKSSFLRISYFNA